MKLLHLKFDGFGWWTADSKQVLRDLVADGDQPGWYGEPYFVAGANDATEAIAAGMPIATAQDGRLTRPSILLD